MRHAILQPGGRARRPQIGWKEAQIEVIVG
jgi:hypothetical protein